MQTLYIDVYFLINFTVDTLAIHFATLLSGVPTTRLRLVISALVGSLCAVVIVLLPELIILKLLGGAVGLVLVGITVSKNVSVLRRCRFVASFLMFGALLGAGVNYLFDLLDGLVLRGLGFVTGAAVNRKLLLMALAVLISIGVFKMIVAFFSGRASAASVKVTIHFLDKSISAEALVDTGNLATDPMDMRPVMLIKENLARKLLPESIITLGDPDSLDKSVRKRIRLIPISDSDRTKVLTGVRLDKVTVQSEGRSEDISVTLAIDREGGNFGGYDILMPAAAIENTDG